MNKSIIALSILASLCVLPVAHAAESALNTTPKIDAAIVPSGAGFATKAEENAIGMKGSHNEGIVIRGSYIENGKIVIPPAGLYYTNRGPRQYMLRGDALQMLGKMRYLANYDSYGAVVANKEFKPGETFRLTPNTLFKLQGISPKGNGHANPVASFVFVRPSGVLTGNKHSINASPDYPYVDTYKMPFTPTKLETGIYPIDANHRFDLNNFTSSFSQAPNTYVLADNLNEKSIMVLEAAMTAVDNVYVSDTKPISGWYKAGDTIPLGNYTAKVEKVDAAAGTATVSLTGKDGKKTEKVLGPMPMNLEKILISSTVEPVEVFMLKSPDKTAQVEISAYADGGFIKNDTVALNLHKDLYPLQLGKEWPSDPKFLYRPDHWVSCMGIIETLIENKEPIILDATNKVFVGPDGYFKIVIDEFDGTTIKAWHIEGPGGVKTANLAMPSNGKHIDAIINSAGNSTARGLYTDMAPAVLQKMLEAQKM